MNNTIINQGDACVEDIYNGCLSVFSFLYHTLQKYLHLILEGGQYFCHLKKRYRFRETKDNKGTSIRISRK